MRTRLIEIADGPPVGEDRLATTQANGDSPSDLESDVDGKKLSSSPDDPSRNIPRQQRKIRSWELQTTLSNGR